MPISSVTATTLQHSLRLLAGHLTTAAPTPLPASLTHTSLAASAFVSLPLSRFVCASRGA